MGRSRLKWRGLKLDTGNRKPLQGGEVKSNEDVSPCNQICNFLSWLHLLFIWTKCLFLLALQMPHPTIHFWHMEITDPHQCNMNVDKRNQFFFWRAKDVRSEMTPYVRALLFFVKNNSLPVQLREHEAENDKNDDFLNLFKFRHQQIMFNLHQQINHLFGPCLVLACRYHITVR